MNLTRNKSGKYSLQGIESHELESILRAMHHWLPLGHEAYRLREAARFIKGERNYLNDIGHLCESEASA